LQFVRLGWAVRGPLPAADNTSDINIHFGQCSDVILQQQLERLWTTDFSDVMHCDKPSMSIEDKKALKTMESSLVRENRHYQMGLPWREDDVSLPNNVALANVRLQQLKKKLYRDPLLHEKYAATMTDYIDKGYAKEITDSEVTDRTLYLPHHPVTNENKPGKVRVVFDCAAKFRDVSLNSKLLQGPDLTKSLVGVLLRFRQKMLQ